MCVTFDTARAQQDIYYILYICWSGTRALRMTSKPPKCLTDYLDDYNQGILAANTMLKKGIMNKMLHAATVKSLTLEYKAALESIHKSTKAPRAGPIGIGMPKIKLPGADDAEDEEDEVEKKDRAVRSCKDRGKCEVAARFSSMLVAREAVAVAFSDGTLFPHLNDHADAALNRDFKKPKGAGEPSRGYMDWEFRDGTACRCDTPMIRAYAHDTPMVRP